MNKIEMVQNGNKQHRVPIGWITDNMPVDKNRCKQLRNGSTVFNVPLRWAVTYTCTYISLDMHMYAHPWCTQGRMEKQIATKFDTHTHLHAYQQTAIHTVQMLSHAHTHTYTLSPWHDYTHACTKQKHIPVFMYDTLYGHTRVRARTHTRMHTLTCLSRTHVHSCMHTHARTYTCTYTHLYSKYIIL